MRRSPFFCFCFCYAIPPYVSFVESIDVPWQVSRWAERGGHPLFFLIMTFLNAFFGLCLWSGVGSSSKVCGKGSAQVLRGQPKHPPGSKKKAVEDAGGGRHWCIVGPASTGGPKPRGTELVVRRRAWKTCQKEGERGVGERSRGTCFLLLSSFFFLSFSFVLSIFFIDMKGISLMPSDSRFYWHVFSVSTNSGMSSSSVDQRDEMPNKTSNILPSGVSRWYHCYFYNSSSVTFRIMRRRKGPICSGVRFFRNSDWYAATMMDICTPV